MNFPKETNINELHKAAYDFVIQHPEETRLFSCFCNGKPTSAICKITPMEDDSFSIQPMFVVVDSSMNITDHDDVQTTPPD